MMKSATAVIVVLLLGILFSSLEPVQATQYKHLGCFKDSWKGRALPHHLGTFPKIIAVKKCAALAEKRGYTTFAVQYGGQCFSGTFAGHSYNRYGRTTKCRGGVGGTWANDVYQFTLYVILKRLRNNYRSLRTTIDNQGRRLDSLRRNYKSLSNKELYLRNRFNALDHRVKRSHVVCHNKATSWQPYSGAPLMYLDRHDVSCPHGYYLARFVLRRTANRNSAPIRYIYRCCKFVL